MRSLCSLNGNEWQADKSLVYAIKHSTRVRMPLNVIKGVSPNVILCHLIAYFFALSKINF